MGEGRHLRAQFRHTWMTPVHQKHLAAHMLNGGTTQSNKVHVRTCGQVYSRHNLRHIRYEVLLP
jgi:hypothetical protein